jgi:uncharacterized protein YjiS (DUF1127 family)
MDWVRKLTSMSKPNPELVMNWQSIPAGIPLSRAPLETVFRPLRDALRARANVLLARVRHLAPRPKRGRDDLAAMNAYLLRDLGLEGAQVLRAPEPRDLQLPRL